MINYSVNGAEITSDISENITQDSYIPAGTTVSILNDVTIEPNVKLTISKTGKLIVPQSKTLTISPGATLTLRRAPYETPDVFEYPVAEWSSEITDPDGDGIYTDSVFTYTKEEDNFVRSVRYRIAPVGIGKDEVPTTEATSCVVQYQEDKAFVFWSSNKSDLYLRSLYKESDNSWSDRGYSKTNKAGFFPRLEGIAATGLFFPTKDVLGGWGDADVFEQALLNGTVIYGRYGDYVN